jgi:hypothetical protein
VDIAQKIREAGIKLVHNNMPVSAVKGLLDLPNDTLFGKFENDTITLFTASLGQNSTDKQMTLAYLLEYANYAAAELDVEVQAYATRDTMSFIHNFWLPSDNLKVLQNTIATLIPVPSLVSFADELREKIKGNGEQSISSAEFKVELGKGVVDAFDVTIAIAIERLKSFGINLKRDAGKLVDMDAVQSTSSSNKARL